MNNKWWYINQISKMSNSYGDLLIALMDKYNRCCLMDITLEEAKAFYNQIMNR